MKKTILLIVTTYLNRLFNAITSLQISNQYNLYNIQFTNTTEQANIQRVTMKPKKLMNLFLATFSILFVSPALSESYLGRWKLLKRSIGISAMHIQLLPNDKIITFDRNDFGPSNISLPEGRCMTSESQSTDCYAHSVEFSPVTRNIRPLTILTDTWCSSGALSQDGVLIQSGGYGLGERVVRSFSPCSDCDWIEDPNGLIQPRWYSSNQVLPDGKIIVVGGRYQFNYEFIPKTRSDAKLYRLPFLKQTRYSPLIPNNLYPFLHLSPDGNLFVFANDRAILLDYVNNKVVKNYPVMPGGISRNYPSTGSSLLLPITLNTNFNTTPEAEILICGGTLPDSNQKANEGVFVLASKSCGRMVITAENPGWEMEEMPLNRVMGDMILLPTGDVLIVNGASKGTAGWNVAREPVLNPVLYRPNSPRKHSTSRFETMAASTIPRLYHSSAHLLSDGRVLIGGSNPNRNYNFTATYPTELSLEAFYPPYLNSNLSRPSIASINPGTSLNYKQKFSIELQLPGTGSGDVSVTMVAPSFTTHSFAMNQRLLVLASDNVEKVGSGNHVVNVNAPANSALAPPGYYQLFVISESVPSKARWVRIK